MAIPLKPFLKSERVIARVIVRVIVGVIVGVNAGSRIKKLAVDTWVIERCIERHAAQHGMMITAKPRRNYSDTYCSLSPSLQC